MYVLIIAAILLALLGLVGAVVPGIAGTPFSFLALLALSFVKGIDYSAEFLVIMGVIGAVVFAVDYVVPIWGTKRFGGTKAGVLHHFHFPDRLYCGAVGAVHRGLPRRKVRRNRRPQGMEVGLRVVHRVFAWHRH